MVKAAIEGDYANRAFFEDSATPGGERKRLRAQVQNTLTDFATTMRLRGHSKTNVESDQVSTKATTASTSLPASSPSPPPSPTLPSARPPSVPRSQFVKDVSSLIKLNRGHELPGTFNPLIVGEMFSTHCKPWPDLAKSYANTVFDVSRATLIAALRHVADGETASRLITNLLNPAFDELGSSVETKLQELLGPHVEGRPITCNRYLTENIQKAQRERHASRIVKALEPFMNPASNTNDYQQFTPSNLPLL